MSDICRNGKVVKNIYITKTVGVTIVCFRFIYIPLNRIYEDETQILADIIRTCLWHPSIRKTNSKTDQLFRVQFPTIFQLKVNLNNSCITLDDRFYKSANYIYNCRTHQLTHITNH